MNPNITFLFYNYAFPFYRLTGEKATVGGVQYPVYERATDRQAIHYGVAAALLGEGSAFAFGSDDSMQYIMDDVYFYVLGTPLGAYQDLGADTYLRFFSAGFVIVAKDERIVQVALPQGVTAVVDLFTKETIQAVQGKVSLSLQSQVYPSGRRYPIGRLYLYGAKTIQNILTVTKAGTGTGTVTATGCTLNWVGNIGTCTVNHGTVITLSGIPDAGSTFTGWSGEGCGGTGTCTVTMDRARNVTATFTLLTGITVVTPNGGEVWAPGSTQTIRWDYVGSVGTYVKIELFKGGGTEQEHSRSCLCG